MLPSSLTNDRSLRLGLDLGGIFGIGIAHRLPFGVTEGGVVVEVDLGIDGESPRPSGVTTSGLISTSEQSFFQKTLDEFGDDVCGLLR